MCTQMLIVDASKAHIKASGKWRKMEEAVYED